MFCTTCHTSDCPGCVAEPTAAEVLQQRRMACAAIFYDVESTAHDLAVKASAIGEDPVMVAFFDDRRAEYRAHLDALSDPEGMNWSAGIRS